MIPKKIFYNRVIGNSVWLFPLSIIIFLPFNNICNVFFGIVILFGIMYLFCDIKNIINNKKIKLYFILFMCIYIPMIISLPDAINHTETLRKIIGFTLFIFLGIAVIKIFEEQSKGDLLIFSIGILLTFWIIDALMQFIIGVDIFGYPYDKGQLRGVFYPHFRIGIILAIFSPIYFEFIRLSQDKFELSWTLLFLFLIIILLAGNRNAWFMLFLSSVLYFLFIYHIGLIKQIKVRPLLFSITIIAIFIILIVIIRPSIIKTTKSLISSRVSTISIDLHNSEKINSLEHRIQIWETGLRIARVHWFNGIGIRGFRYIDRQKYVEQGQSVISEETSISTHPHQTALEILVETGMVGILGYILFWIIFVRLFIKIIKNEQALMCWPWFITVLVSMFPLNMHKAFYGHFSSIIIWLLVSFLIAFYPEDALKNKI